MKRVALTECLFRLGNTWRPALPVLAFGHVLRTIALAALLLPAVSLANEPASNAVPANAHKDGYGNGWQCDLGYRLNGDVCDALLVPANAYPTNRSYGTGWKCERGYTEIARERCEKIEVPENAYLAANGDRWRCLRGFVKRQDTCQAITVPANGYLSDEVKRRGWDCNRGFEVVGNDCVKLTVPQNGYLTNRNYGAAWHCERGYRRQNDACVVVTVPENAFFKDGSFSLGWQCNRGFERAGQNCVAIAVPPNAHLKRTGNAWECDRSFSASSGNCVRNE